MNSKGKKNTFLNKKRKQSSEEENSDISNDNAIELSNENDDSENEIKEKNLKNNKNNSKSGKPEKAQSKSDNRYNEDITVENNEVTLTVNWILILLYF